MPETVLYFLDDPSRDKHFHGYVLSGLENAGYDPIVTYLWRGPVESKLEALGHKTWDLGCPPESSRGFHPVVVGKVRNAIQKTRAVAAHVQRHRPMIYAALAGYLTRLPVLFYTVRISRTLRTFTRRMAFSLVSSRITRVIAVSEGVKQEFVAASRIQPGMVEVIHNGLDPAQFDLGLDRKEARETFGLPQDAFLFGMVASLRRAKDHRGLIQAFSRLNEKGLVSRLVLVGDGPTEGEIRDLVRAKGMASDVIFLRRLPPEKIALILQALDVFVHPTWREGMPAAILEAMASGLPIISTDAEGVTEIFDTPRSFGKLLPRGNEDLLAQAMEALYRATPAERKEMGSQARARLDEAFTHTHMVDRTVALYDRFVRGFDEARNNAQSRSI